MLFRRSRSGPFGVSDASYLELFEDLIDHRMEAAAFGRAFLRLVKSDQRLHDHERYGILQRVFHGCDDLVLDDDQRDADEIDEQQFRAIVAAASTSLRHRRDDWEALHWGDD